MESPAAKARFTGIVDRIRRRSEGLHGGDGSIGLLPEESLAAFELLGAGTMVPMRYGSLRLSGEPQHEPLERLQMAAGERDLAHRVQVLEEGVPAIFGG